MRGDHSSDWEGHGNRRSSADRTADSASPLPSRFCMIEIAGPPNVGLKDSKLIEIEIPRQTPYTLCHYFTIQAKTELLRMACPSVRTSRRAVSTFCPIAVSPLTESPRGWIMSPTSCRFVVVSVCDDQGRRRLPGSCGDVRELRIVSKRGDVDIRLFPH
jgi:hypothetical protein